MQVPVQTLFQPAQKQRFVRSKPALSAVESRLLRTVNEHGILTVKQAMKLLKYKPTAENYVRQLLSGLANKKYLTSSFLSRATQYGSAPSVCTIGTEGRK